MMRALCGKRHGIWIVHPFPCLSAVIDPGIGTFASDGVQRTPGVPAQRVPFALLLFGELFIRDEFLHGITPSRALRNHNTLTLICQILRKRLHFLKNRFSKSDKYGTLTVICFQRQGAPCLRFNSVETMLLRKLGEGK